MKLNVLRHPVEFPRSVKRASHQAYLKAVRYGLLHRPVSCSSCGDAGQIEGHHHNGYDEANALNVIWLCKECHAKAHGVLNLIFGLVPEIKPFAGKFSRPIEAIRS